MKAYRLTDALHQTFAAEAGGKVLGVTLKLNVRANAYTLEVWDEKTLLASSLMPAGCVIYAAGSFWTIGAGYLYAQAQ